MDSDRSEKNYRHHKSGKLFETDQLHKRCVQLLLFRINEKTKLTKISVKLECIVYEKCSSINSIRYSLLI